VAAFQPLLKEDKQPSDGEKAKVKVDSTIEVNGNILSQVRVEIIDGEHSRDPSRFLVEPTHRLVPE
jgi:hypothetical protein